MNSTDYRNQVSEFLLSDHYDLCYRAHQGTSFSPEKRAVMYVRDYSELLKEDLEKLGEHSGNYQAKFIAHFTDWMSAKSRCLSTMIAGPSNFPVRRAQKANNSEHNKYEAFMHWREKYFKAVNRVPTKSPEDDLVIAERTLEQQLNLQLRLKRINAVIRKSKLTDLKQVVNLLLHHEEEFTQAEIKHVREHYTGKICVPGYALTNLNARINSTKGKIQARLVRIQRKKTWEDITFEGGYVTLEDDRLKIYHDEKPSREIIQEIKSNGFRWSPHWTCWCRKHTGNALYTLKLLSFIKEGVS